MIVVGHFVRRLVNNCSTDWASCCRSIDDIGAFDFVFRESILRGLLRVGEE